MTPTKQLKSVMKKDIKKQELLLKILQGQPPKKLKFLMGKDSQEKELLLKILQGQPLSNEEKEHKEILIEKTKSSLQRLKHVVKNVRVVTNFR